MKTKLQVLNEEKGKDCFLKKTTEELFNGTLSTRKTDPVYFKLEEKYRTDICYRPYTASKLHRFCF